MKLEKGSTRMVFVGERFVVKVPRLRFDILADIFLVIRTMDFEGIKNFFTTNEDDAGIKYALFRGIFQNLREARSSAILKDVVVPTRLSILGVLNVQDIAPDLSEDVSITDVVRAITTATNRATWKDTHTFTEPNNYGIHDGHIKLRDYGGRETPAILLQHRDAIIAALEKVMNAI